MTDKKRITGYRILAADGQVLRKDATRAYTHAQVGGEDGTLMPLTFHSSAQSAARALGQDSKGNRVNGTRIVEVMAEPIYRARRQPR